MAYELKAIFEAQDKISAKVRRITQEINKLDMAMKRATSAALNLNNAMNRNANNLNRAGNSYRTYNNTVNNTSNTINRNTNIVNHNTNAIHNNIVQINNYNSASNNMRNSVSRQASSLNNLRNMLVGVAGAYLGAQGAAKLFETTIGAAAKQEQSEVAIKAIFNDDKASSAYLKMVDSMAIDSPLLNSGDMLANSKTLVAMTKNVEDLGKAWSIVERLQVLDPTQGTEGAAFALKEMWGGDALSMKERFGLDKNALNDIKTMSISDQVVELDKLLSGMGITQNTVNAMGQTTLGYWSQLQERAEKFGRQVGNLSNSKLGKVLGDIITKLDNADLDGIAAKFDAKLADITEKAIKLGKFLWEWREPIMYVVGAISAATTALVGVGIIAALASPVSLIAGAIAAAAVGMRALYDNSANFRGMIDGIVTKAQELWSAFQTGGVDGVLSALLPPSMIEDINNMKTQIGVFVDYLAEKWTAIQPTLDMLKFAFQTASENVVSVLSTLWELASPILSLLGNAISIVGDVVIMVFNNIVAPMLAFMAKAFSVLWKVVGPILELLGAAFEVIGTIIMFLWDTILAPFVDYWTSGLVGAFKFVMPYLDKVGGMFETIGGWISTAADYVSGFADNLKKIKVPDWVQKLGGSAVELAQKFIPGNYHGLSNVPYDGYTTRLHKGERVLTAQENKEYNEGGNGGGITITGNSFTVREEADIEKIAYKLAKLIEKEALQIG